MLTAGFAGGTPAHRLVPTPLGWRLGVGSTHGIEQATFGINLVRLLRRE